MFLKNKDFKIYNLYLWNLKIFIYILLLCLGHILIICIAYMCNK